MRALFYLGSMVLGSLLASGCAQPEPPPFKPVADVVQLMEGIIQPAAQVYWSSVATIVSSDGIEERFPRTDEAWEAVWGGALTISEAGNLLMMAPRARDDEWMRLSVALVDVGQLAAKAAESKRPEEVLAMGEKVYNVCTECHMKYIAAE